MSEFVYKSQLYEHLRSAQEASERLAATLERIAFERDTALARAEKAEAELLDTTWQDHADEWQKRAIAAEARAERLSAFIRARMAVSRHDASWESREALIRAESEMMKHGDLKGGGE